MAPKAKATKKSKAKSKTTKAAKKKSSAGGKRDDRDSQRIPIQLLVDYRSDGNYLFDFCRDLGTGGVFIQTTKPLPQGSSVDLTFTIPDSKQTLDAKGTVIWVQAPVEGRKDLTVGMGVQFEAFNNEQRRVLEDFVSRYNETSGGEIRSA